VKLIGKLQDGTVFLKKGHGENEEPFEFKTDEGNYTVPSIFLITFLWIVGCAGFSMAYLVMVTHLLDA